MNHRLLVDDLRGVEELYMPQRSQDYAHPGRTVLWSGSDPFSAISKGA